MTNPHPLTEGLISALEHIAGEERPGHHSLCDCPACVANDALSRHADRLSAQPSTEAVKLADDPRVAALLDSQYRAGATAGWNAQFTNDPVAAIGRLTRYEGGLDALRQSPPLPSIDEVERVAMAIVEEIGWGTFSHFDPNDVRRISRAAIAALMRVDAPKGLDDG